MMLCLCLVTWQAQRGGGEDGAMVRKRIRERLARYVEQIYIEDIYLGTQRGDGAQHRSPGRRKQCEAEERGTMQTPLPLLFLVAPSGGRQG